MGTRSCRVGASVALGLLGLLLVLAATAPPARAQRQLTQQEVNFLLYGPSDQVEAAIGPGMIAQYEATNVVFVDPRVERIAERLQDACPRKGIRVRVVRDTEVNAYCRPGPAVYIHGGLLEAIGNDDDALAAVIGHEMGHANRYHAFNLWRAAVRARLQPQVRNPRTGPVEEIIDAIVGRSSSRDHEREADNDGARYVVRSGFDPEGMFRLLDIFERAGGSRGVKWLQSHPPPKDRIKRLRTFMAKELGVRGLAEETPVTPPKPARQPKPKPQPKPVEVRVTAEPDELRLEPGKAALVRFQFRYGKQPMKLLRRTAVYTTKDGTPISEELGPFDLNLEMPATGKFEWDHRCRLRLPVAEKAVELKLDTVHLRQTFHGELPDGTPAYWTVNVRIRVRKP